MPPSFHNCSASELRWELGRGATELLLILPASLPGSPNLSVLEASASCSLPTTCSD